MRAARIDGIFSAHAFRSQLYPVLALDEERKPIILEKCKADRLQPDTHQSLFHEIAK